MTWDGVGCEWALRVWAEGFGVVDSRDLSISVFFFSKNKRNQYKTYQYLYQVPGTDNTRWQCTGAQVGEPVDGQVGRPTSASRTYHMYECSSYSLYQIILVREALAQHILLWNMYM